MKYFIHTVILIQKLFSYKYAQNIFMNSIDDYHAINLSDTLTLSHTYRHLPCTHIHKNWYMKLFKKFQINYICLVIDSSYT